MQSVFIEKVKKKSVQIHKIFLVCVCGGGGGGGGPAPDQGGSDNILPFQNPSPVKIKAGVRTPGLPPLEPRMKKALHVGVDFILH